MTKELSMRGTENRLWLAAWLVTVLVATAYVTTGPETGVTVNVNEVVPVNALSAPVT